MSRERHHPDTQRLRLGGLRHPRLGRLRLPRTTSDGPAQQLRPGALAAAPQAPAAPASVPSGPMATRVASPDGRALSFGG